MVDTENESCGDAKGGTKRQSELISDAAADKNDGSMECDVVDDGGIVAAVQPPKRPRTSCDAEDGKETFQEELCSAVRERQLWRDQQQQRQNQQQEREQERQMQMQYQLGNSKIPCPREVAEKLQQVIASSSPANAMTVAAPCMDLPPRPPPCSPVPYISTQQHGRESTRATMLLSTTNSSSVLNNDQTALPLPQSNERQSRERHRSRSRSRSRGKSSSPRHAVARRQTTKPAWRISSLIASVVVVIAATFWGSQGIDKVLQLIGMASPPSALDHNNNSKSFVLPPTTTSQVVTSDLTLRHFLLHPDGIELAMAPAFFGFYGYFGALAAWHDALEDPSYLKSKDRIHGVSGASAGAMAAILLAAGIDPTIAAQFCTTITLGQFADPPGLGAAFKGNKFEELMHEFLREQTNGERLRMEDAILPVAVSGFDLQTMAGVLLKHGSMARAARASATFPLLFQPVGWTNGVGVSENRSVMTTPSDMQEDYTLIDGGIMDPSGLNGLSSLTLQPQQRSRRIVNLVVGSFFGGLAPGPTKMPKGVHASEVLSISLLNLPPCGPWAMENGPLAVEAARTMMQAAMDIPLHKGLDTGHYELHLDAALFQATNGD